MPRLTPAARRFRTWLTAHFETAGCQPLADELIREYDHLVTLRQLAAEARDRGDSALYLRYCSALSKAGASFIRIWKCAGLAGVELPAEIRHSANRR
jgi:hypothetical protein